MRFLFTLIIGGFFFLSFFFFFPEDALAFKYYYGNEFGPYVRCDEADPTNCECTIPGTVDVSTEACQNNLGSPANTCTGASGRDSPCGWLGPWEWCYASGCQARTVFGDCSFGYTYSYTNCGAYDVCLSQSYLNPGYCGSSGCTYGGTVYKTCCNSDGTVNGNCTVTGSSGYGFDYGTCGGSITVMCGVDAGTCAAVIPLGYQCTTNPCGPSACAILASPSPSPSSSPAPSPSPGESPAPSPSAPPPRPCDWCTNEAFCSSSGGTFYSDIWDYCAVDGDGVCCVDGGLTRYSCSGTSCVADPDGPYSNSGCDGSCSDPKPCVECIVWDAYDPPGKDGDMICLSFKRPDISADCGWCASSDPPQPDWDDCWNIDPPPSYCESNEVTWCWCQPQCQSSGTVIYFDPVSPDPGQEFYVKVESNTGYTYVGLTGTDGAGNAISPLYIGWFPGAGYTNQWRWQIQDAVAGTYNLNFTINKADSACPGDNPCQTGSVLVAGPSPSPSPASAWIQVDGDVHSNTGIDTPRGPGP